jgi:hypothetical protein
MSELEHLNIQPYTGQWVLGLQRLHRANNTCVSRPLPLVLPKNSQKWISSQAIPECVVLHSNLVGQFQMQINTQGESFVCNRGFSATQDA